MTRFPEEVGELAARVIYEFSAGGLMVVTAESCTGGLIAGALTEIAGSSAVVDRGFVTYSNEAKQEMIGVKPETLAAHGAVSKETALEMAAGALAKSRADLSVAVTGIAGPGGGTAEKPVGLVHLAACRKDGRSQHLEMRFGALGRDGVRTATVRVALDLLLELAQAE